MVVQSTNTGGDLGNNHFDIMMPGGGLGIFDGCTPEFGGIPGERYGGVAKRSDCDGMPELLKDGCYWRFDWFKNADNPDFTFEQVQCPKALTAKTGCTRNDDSSFPAAPAGSSSGSSKASAAVSKAPAAVSKAAVVSSKAAVATSKAVVVSKPQPTSSSGTVAVYAQCGGPKEQFPNGSVACATGSKCVKQNDYYSQCLPN